jgi:HSP20 family protein
MIFAPVIRRAAFNQAPHSADLALQRFLMGALSQPSAAQAAAATAADSTAATAPAAASATTAPVAMPNVATSATAFSVTQDDKATTLHIDVPGLSREQLGVTIEGQVVQLRSATGAPRHVQRGWELAHEIDAAASSARLENGVLTLTLVHVVPVSKAATLSIQ